MSDRLIRRLLWLASRPATHASDDWAPALNPSRPEQPYPFIYHPRSGFLAWGQQNGLHDDLVNGLYQQGQQVPAGSLFGRWYPKNQNLDMIIYDKEFKQLPPSQQEMYRQTIRRNAPGGPQEAPGAASTDSWHLGSFPDEEEEWTPSIPDLEEVAQPSPERYFKWLHHPMVGTRVWEVDGPDGEPWHARMQSDWLGYANPMGAEAERGYGVANHNGGVVHNYGSGYASHILPQVAQQFQEQYSDIPWRAYTPTEPLDD